MRRRFTVLAVAALVIGLVPIVSAGAVTDPAVVYTDSTTFVSDTGAAAVPFPASADTALPSKPFGGGFLDYSCAMPSLSLAGGDVTVVNPSGNWICYIGPGWNAGLGNTNPTPLTPTIVNNGEDDYHVMIDFAEPQQAVGFGLLTNSSATESVKLFYADGSTEVIADAALGTAANSFEFVGFWSYEPIIKVELDTTGGGSQNEGITGIWSSPITWTDSCPTGEVFVSSEGVGEATSVVSIPAAPGYPYAITVHGTYFAGGIGDFDIQADAEYSQDWYQRMNLLPWTDLVRGYEGLGEGLLEMKVDGGFVEWGAFDNGHSYSIEHTATGATIDFQIYDTYAQNNTGGLCVGVEPIPLTDINGAGRIIEPIEDAKPLKVSFGGWLQDIDGGVVCTWEVNLHRVDANGLNKSKFHATTCDTLNTFPGAWDGIVNFKAYGTFNGEPGHWAIFRMEDYTEPGDMDTFRIEISKTGGGLIYDSSWPDEFSDESSNEGTARTLLNRGNIQIHFYE
jgi:hypothetical protein